MRNPPGPPHLAARSRAATSREIERDPEREGGIAIGFQYLLLMLGCLLITLPLEWLFGARVYRRFGTLLLALLPVVVLFSIWDIVGIIRNHWTYNPNYVTGLQLVFSMPIEELVFFIVIPICGLLAYEAVGDGLRRLGQRRGPGRAQRQPDTEEQSA